MNELRTNTFEQNCPQNTPMKKWNSHDKYVNSQQKT